MESLSDLGSLDPTSGLQEHKEVKQAWGLQTITLPPRNQTQFLMPR